VLAATSPFIWYTTRATGTVALVLLTATMVLGILTTTRAGSDGLPRFAVADLHRRISLIALVFLGLHILTAVADTYVPIGWWSVVVPFTSVYKPLWVGLGTVAFDLLLAVAVTSMLRGVFSARAWRAVHWLAYACWPVAVAHGIGVGTDLRFGWMQALVALCIVSVLVALGWRVWAHPYRGGHRTAVPRGRGPGATTPGAPVPRADDRLVATSRAPRRGRPTGPWS